MSENFSVSSKICASLSYATWGIFGFILLLLKKADEHFLKFHIYQSLLLGILFLLIQLCFSEIFHLLGGLLSFSKILKNALSLTNSLIQTILIILQLGTLIYSLITIWRNKYTWFKWISSQVYKML